MLITTVFCGILYILVDLTLGFWVKVTETESLKKSHPDDNISINLNPFSVFLSFHVFILSGSCFFCVTVVLY